MATSTFFSLIFLAMACSSPDGRLMDLGHPDREFEEMLDIPITEQPPPPMEGAKVEETPSEKIIRRGGIDFRSRDLEEDYRKLKNLLPTFQAFAENENKSASVHQKAYNLTIRVPSEQFDTLMSAISGLAFRLDNRYSNREDITGNYYDLQSRIKNKKALEERYLELLKQATNVKDMLEIERALNEIRTEIDRMEGRFVVLGNQVALSTLHVYLYENLSPGLTPVLDEGVGQSILLALTKGWQGFVLFLLWLVRIWPFLIIGGVAVFFWRRRRQRVKGNSPSQ
ncbi:MAG: DUF4349 domain-containing protein [Lunatimonas sp.]|uniref:DUF4349 domain-containing protein n=1 Tax=Lunatimonas sp. TaxID=2060141 RepID=UPI00263AC56D|nr:DUF4349 domain-containing protein [Lunatimonas sp.]MCC5937787.1 DUF4349 domain-containing protein [Lunatimonas sp.]